MVVSTKKLPHRLHCCRTFIAAKVKWVRDPYLDTAVSKEKDLKQAIFLKNQIIFSPSKFLPLSSLSLLKTPLHLSTTASKFFQKYPFIFRRFQPSPSLPLHIKLTHLAYSLHNEEELAVYNSPPQRDDSVKRLAKLLMLARATRLPLHVIDRFSFDLGLPHNYITALLSDYPEYFRVCEFKDWVNNEETLALELVSWREELAMSELEKRMAANKGPGIWKGKQIAFPMTLPRGFDLTKKVRDWVDEWQDLPYISPYENAFHLSPPDGDQAEKWTVAVLHELLWLLVSKKTEWGNIFCLGEYLGFGSRFKKALKHHPGIFYVSNKIRTQTVVLREAYKKDMLLVKHPLMGMRYRYIHLMNMMKKP